MYSPVSVIITTYNRSEKIKKCLDHLLKLDYPNYEIVVVNDGSTDNTSIVLKNYEKNHKDMIKIIQHKKNKGTGAGKKSGILNSNFDMVALIDDDCYVEKTWLRNLITAFIKEEKKGKKIAAVTSVGVYTGHSICYKKNIVIKAGLFDERFSRAFREDTDLAFRILDLGYEIIQIPEEGFIHDPPSPKTMKEKIHFAFKRIMIHQWDVLLYKKHPERTKKFLNIKLGFIRNPVEDFRIATGLWYRGRRKISLSSPQGIEIISNKTIFHTLIIFLLGFFYVFAVKFARFVGTLKFNKFLI